MEVAIFFVPKRCCLVEWWAGGAFGEGAKVPKAVRKYISCTGTMCPIPI